MRELYRHIGENIDIPAGDIGVGAREIGYLYGYYKRVVNEHTGVMTGKSIEWGGSFIRPQATGYGLVYFTAEMFARRGMSLENLTVAVSGAGNVAQAAAEKAMQMGARVIGICDSESSIIDEEGIDAEKLEFIKEQKNIRRGKIKEYSSSFPSVCFTGKSIWDVILEGGLRVDIAFPCATQNEISAEHAEALVRNGCKCVAEGANMPCTPGAIKVFKENGLLYAPGKAANAGGVAVSGLEMSQNSLRYLWDREKVNRRLIEIMKNIHNTVLEVADEYSLPGDYEAGANIAGFLKVARAMYAQGIV